MEFLGENWEVIPSSADAAITVLAMNELWPDPVVDLDVGATVAGEDRQRPDGQPWVTMLMISSLDGAAALDGVSGGLGGPADKAIFGAMRSMADAIVVGGGTAQAENYGPVPQRRGDAAIRRAEAGQEPRPQLAVLSRRLPFDPDDRLFSDPDARPILYTVAGDADQLARRGALAPVADIVELPGPEISVSDVVADLAKRGCHRILLEGGPRVNGSFLAKNLVDEIHLSLAPVAVGGTAPRIITGPDSTDTGAAAQETVAEPPAKNMKMVRVWMGDGLLFLRYVRAD